MNEHLKYKLLAFIRYLGDSLYYPFFALFLKNQGLIEGKIGFLISIAPLIGILTNPLYSMICKNFKITKNVLTIMGILEAIFITCISLTSNYYVIIVLTVLIALFGTCHYGLMDSLISVFSTKNNMEYSGIRMFGSIAYVIGTTLGGILIKVISFKGCFIFSTVLFILAGLIYFIIKPIDASNEEKAVKIKEVTRNKNYWLFVIPYVLLYSSMNIGDNFFSIYLESRGISSFQYGIIYSYFVIVEIVLLFIFSKLKPKISNFALLACACSVLIIRFICNGLYLNLYLVIVLAGARGVAYAIILYTSFKSITKIVGVNMATKGIMLMTLLSSILIFIGNNLLGKLIEKVLNYTSFYLILLIPLTISLILEVINIIKDKHVERINL